MTEFKVGDRVRVLEDHANAAQVIKGDTGTVTHTEDDFVDVEMEEKSIYGGTQTWSFEPNKLELVEDDLREVHDVAISTLARISKELGVMISLTVYPSTEEESPDS